jgi:hypothetical protein
MFQPCLKLKIKQQHFFLFKSKQKLIYNNIFGNFMRSNFHFRKEMWPVFVCFRNEFIMFLYNLLLWVLLNHPHRHQHILDKRVYLPLHRTIFQSLLPYNPICTHIHRYLQNLYTDGEYFKNDGTELKIGFWLDFRILKEFCIIIPHSP